jgi:hypothetical protein
MLKQALAALTLGLTLASCGTATNAPTPTTGDRRAPKHFGLSSVFRDASEVSSVNYDLEAGLIDGHVYQVSVNASQFVANGVPFDVMFAGVIKDGVSQFFKADFPSASPFTLAGLEISPGASSASIHRTMSPDDSGIQVDVNLDFKATSAAPELRNDHFVSNFGIKALTIDHQLLQDANVTGTVKYTIPGQGTTTLQLPATTLVPPPGSQQTVGTQTVQLISSHHMSAIIF